MIEGLWIVQFHGPTGYGGGVVVLTNGKAYGGDSGFVYVGSYEMKGESFTANVAVKNFDANIPNVIGITGDFDLLIEGNVKGDTISGTGALAKAPNAKISVRLTRHTKFA